MDTIFSFILHMRWLCIEHAARETDEGKYICYNWDKCAHAHQTNAQYDENSFGFDSHVCVSLMFALNLAMWSWKTSVRSALRKNIQWESCCGKSGEDQYNLNAWTVNIALTSHAYNTHTHRANDSVSVGATCIHCVLRYKSRYKSSQLKAYVFIDSIWLF